MKTFITTVFLTIMSNPAFAAVAERVDNSMFLVYCFLGVCGMIIFLQIIPVLAVAYGIVKALFSKKVTH